MTCSAGTGHWTFAGDLRRIGWPALAGLQAEIERPRSAESGARAVHLAEAIRKDDRPESLPMEQGGLRRLRLANSPRAWLMTEAIARNPTEPWVIREARIHLEHRASDR